METGVIHDIPTFLIMPIQRIPRYNLLLLDIKKHTWEEHGDYQNLVKACEGMEEVAQYLNSKKKESDNIGNMMKYGKMIVDGPTIIEPGREFVMEVNAKIKGKGVVCILFSDILLFAQKSKKKLKYK